MAAARVVAAFIPWTRFQIWARGVVDGLPAIVAVLLFGVPLIVSEFGAFISVVLMATGHLLIGSTMYIALKIVGVSLKPKTRADCSSTIDWTEMPLPSLRGALATKQSRGRVMRPLDCFAALAMTAGELARLFLGVG